MKIFPEEIFERNQYTLISRDLSLTDINKLKLLGDPAIQLHKSNKRVYPQHNLFSHIIGLKTSNLSSKLEKNLDSDNLMAQLSKQLKKNME